MPPLQGSSTEQRGTSESPLDASAASLPNPPAASLPNASEASIPADDVLTNVEMDDVEEGEIEAEGGIRLSAADAAVMCHMLDEDDDTQEGVGLAGLDSMMSGIEEVSSTMPDPSGGVKPKPIEELRRRYNEMKAEKAASNEPKAAGRPSSGPIPGEKRNRSGSSNTSTPAPKKVKAMKWPFKEIFTKKTFKCAISVGEDSPIVGNPFEDRPEIQITVELDAGNVGTPSVGLNFRFRKAGTDAEDDGADNYNYFTVGYEPGIRIEGKHMMQDLVYRKAKHAEPRLLPISFPDAVRTLCKTEQDEDNLYWMTFDANSHRATRYDLDWVDSLTTLPDTERTAIGDTMMRLMEDSDSYRVEIWFINRREITANVTKHHFTKHCLEPLRVAVKTHVPPLHQYRDNDGNPAVNLDMPSIQEVGDGMYVRYAKRKADSTTEGTAVGKVGFLNIPKKVTWEQIKDFYIYQSVPIVREYQFVQGTHANMQRGFHRVFLERMPIFVVDGQKIVPDKQMWNKSFYAGVRMRRDQHGARDTIPPEGSIMKLDLNAPVLTDYVEEDHEDEIWYGRVVSRSKELLRQVNVDFWILVSRPKTVLHEPKSYQRAALRPDDKLLPAKLSVKTNPSMALRELKAMNKFCDETQLQKLLGEIRLAMTSDPSRAKDVKYKDLSWGPTGNKSAVNKAKWDSLMEKFSKTRLDNPSQMAVLRSAENMRSNLVTCNGPPGAGKTSTLSDMMMALAHIGHKVLCCAASNAAVDLIAKKVFHALEDEGRKELKCLRLESDAAEKAARLTKINYAAYEGDIKSQFKKPEYKSTQEAQDNPVMRNALDRLATGFMDREVQMERILQEYDTVEEAYTHLQETDRLRKSDVDVGMTLDYRIWEVTHADRKAALEQYEAARSQMTSPEFAAAYAAGTISVEHFDKSFEYRTTMRNYIDCKGKISPKQKTQLEAASDAMVSRVLAQTDILFTTASNAGGKLLENGATFNPSVIICDEAGQISIPSLCVPLTSFGSWEGLFLFGDPNQLEPTFTSGQFNELLANGKLSPLAMCHEKGFPGLLLDTQYRMCPAIAAFPNTQFYDGLLKNHPKACQDNAFRQKMRLVSEDFAIKVTPPAETKKPKSQRQRQGSEYFVVDVKHGTSRIEPGGTSLVNHANAKMVLQIAQAMLIRGIGAEHIKILTYYQGQKRLLRKTIDEATHPIWTAESKAAIEVSTVDAFQGRESNIVILDLVVAKDPVLDKAARQLRTDQYRQELRAREAAAAAGENDDGEAGEEENLDNGTEDYVKTGAITSHMKNPSRLDVALTRAMDGLVVVCQERVLCTDRKQSKVKKYAALMNMVTNARVRGLLGIIRNIEDEHPDAKQLRLTLPDGELARLRQRLEVQDKNPKYSFIETAKKASAKMRTQKTSEAIKVPTYRTSKGHTTRPMPLGDKEAADAYDRKVAEEKKTLELKERARQEEEAARQAQPSKRAKRAAQEKAPGKEEDLEMLEPGEDDAAGFLSSDNETDDKMSGN